MGAANKDRYTVHPMPCGTLHVLCVCWFSTAGSIAQVCNNKHSRQHDHTSTSCSSTHTK